MKDCAQTEVWGVVVVGISIIVVDRSVFVATWGLLSVPEKRGLGFFYNLSPIKFGAEFLTSGSFNSKNEARTSGRDDAILTRQFSYMRQL